MTTKRYHVVIALLVVALVFVLYRSAVAQQVGGTGHASGYYGFAFASQFWAEPSSDTSLSAGDTITVTHSNMRIKGNGSVTLTSQPHIADAEDGTCVVLWGVDDSISDGKRGVKLGKIGPRPFSFFLS